MSSADTSATTRDLAAAAPVRLSSIEVRLIKLTLVRPFETSFGRMDARIVPLVRMVADGVEGWGEIVADHEPLFSCRDDRHRAARAGRLLHPGLAGAARCPRSHDVAAALRRFKGHQMAKAGLELAFMDLAARSRGVSIREAIGGTRERVPVGVSLGIEKDVPTLVDQVLAHVAQGYQRIKLKIKPGWDVDVVRAVREAYPTGLLSVDANTAYTLADTEHLRQLDAFDLLMIEQPLAHDDMVDHAALQRAIRTDICLDESIVHARAAAHALALGSCRLINIKIGRVGGYTEALGIHDACQAHGAPGVVRRHARVRHRSRAQPRAGQPAELLAAWRHLREQAVLGARRDHEAIRGRGRRHRRGADAARASASTSTTPSSTRSPSSAASSRRSGRRSRNARSDRRPGRRLRTGGSGKACSRRTSPTATAIARSDSYIGVDRQQDCRGEGRAVGQRRDLHVLVPGVRAVADCAETVERRHAERRGEVAVRRATGRALPHVEANRRAGLVRHREQPLHVRAPLEGRPLEAALPGQSDARSRARSPAAEGLLDADLLGRPRSRGRRSRRRHARRRRSSAIRRRRRRC